MLSSSPTGTISGRLKPQTEEVPRRDQGTFGTANRSPGLCCTARARSMNDRFCVLAVDFRSALPTRGIFANPGASNLPRSPTVRLNDVSRKNPSESLMRRWPTKGSSARFPGLANCRKGRTRCAIRPRTPSPSDSTTGRRSCVQSA